MKNLLNPVRNWGGKPKDLLTTRISSCPSSHRAFVLGFISWIIQLALNQLGLLSFRVALPCGPVWPGNADSKIKTVTSNLFFLFFTSKQRLRIYWQLLTRSLMQVILRARMARYVGCKIRTFLISFWHRSSLFSLFTSSGFIGWIF